MNTKKKQFHADSSCWFDYGLEVHWGVSLIVLNLVSSSVCECRFHYFPSLQFIVLNSPSFCFKYFFRFSVYCVKNIQLYFGFLLSVLFLYAIKKYVCNCGEPDYQNLLLINLDCGCVCLCVLVFVCERQRKE